VRLTLLLRPRLSADGDFHSDAREGVSILAKAGDRKTQENGLSGDSKPHDAVPPAPGAGSVALVVGASGSLGDALAARLAERCSAVGLHAFRNRHVCDARAEKLRAAGRRAAVFVADISSWEECGKLVESCLHEFGRVDELYLCAGVSEDAPLPRLTPEKWRRIVGVNVDGPFFILRRMARQFVKQRGGLIVAIGSHAGVCGRAGGSVYAASKSALIGLIKSAAREFGAFGVRAVCVLPGFMPDSGMARSAGDRFVESVRKSSCLREFAGRDDVARFIAALAGMKFASGQVFNIDGRIIPFG
jgi:3-oxoacyl-[acyl-carrier protein] reductase